MQLLGLSSKENTSKDVGVISSISKYDSQVSYHGCNTTGQNGVHVTYSTYNYNGVPTNNKAAFTKLLRVRIQYGLVTDDLTMRNVVCW